MIEHDRLIAPAAASPREEAVERALRPRSLAYKAALAVQLRATVWPLIEAGKVKPVIHQVFPAVQAAQAHALMESSVHVGKIVLNWSS